ncbi:hypothetical protein KCP69_07075 [Salmonella enterica subsp. enterica]|nr:hypothetical protein KCP69_07075 [Salmonella enterica subsp. enterica]
MIAQNENVVPVTLPYKSISLVPVTLNIWRTPCSASGGQLDFCPTGAYASKGGRSIITTRSTAVNDTISRIVPALRGL